jgi:hypothetical protein
MVLIVIDTQAHTHRTVMVPVKASRPSTEPALIIAHPAIDKPRTV